jgi:cysteine synthase A
MEAHLLGTAVEIWDDMNGEMDVLVASVGTSGTLSGTAKTLKTSYSDLKVVAVEPSASNVLNGGKKGNHCIHGIGAGFVPPLYDKDLVNEIKDVSDDDAWAMAKLVAQTEGLPIGVSAGAAMVAAIELAQRDDMNGKKIVVILPDAINNYLSEL